MRRMSLGQVVDFCIEYNKRHSEEADEKDNKKKGTKYRLMTGREVSQYFGG